jgi:hypothetical protein
MHVMMPFLRKKLFTTIVCMIVSVQLFNLSFDPADISYGKEDLSINEIESCLELILEIILGHDDAVKESDESDEATDRPGSTVTLFTISASVLLEENQNIEIKSSLPIILTTNLESVNLPIISPPPKA